MNTLNIKNYGIFSKDLKAYLSLISTSTIKPLKYNDWWLGSNGTSTIKMSIERVLKDIIENKIPHWKKDSDLYYMLVDVPTPRVELERKYHNIFPDGKKRKYFPQVNILTFYVTSIYISKFNIIQILSLIKNHTTICDTVYLENYTYYATLKLHLKFKMKNLFKKQTPEDLEQYLFDNMNAINIIQKNNLKIDNVAGLKDLMEILLVEEVKDDKKRVH